jgi:hypothetical protein
LFCCFAQHCAQPQPCSKRHWYHLRQIGFGHEHTMILTALFHWLSLYCLGAGCITNTVSSIVICVSTATICVYWAVS